MQTDVTKRRDTRRRGRGEGSIHQRADDGDWVATVSLGKDGNGKRIRRQVRGKTKKDVLDELAKLQGDKAAGKAVATDRATVGEALDKFLASLEVNQSVQDTTLANYRRVVRLHITPYAIAGKRLQQVSYNEVEVLLKELADAGVGANPRRLARIVLNRAFKKAVKQGAVRNNPCEVVDAPRVGKANIHPLNANQAGALLWASKKIG